MRSQPLRRLPALIAVLVLALSVGVAGADDHVDELQLFQRNTAEGCGSDARMFLSPEAGRGEVGCGFIGGLPFGEVFATADDTETFRDTFSTRTTEVDPFVLDSARAVTGQIAISPDGVGAGQIRVDLRLTALPESGNQRVELGSTTVEEVVVSILGSEVLEYEIALPEAVDGQTFRQVTLEVYVRGIHAMHGFNELNGQSFVTLPVVAPDPAG